MDDLASKASAYRALAAPQSVLQSFDRLLDILIGFDKHPKCLNAMCRCTGLRGESPRVSTLLASPTNLLR